MQQYFTAEELTVGEEYIFTKEQSHHANTVLHLNHEKVRLVYQGIGFFAEAYQDGKVFKAKVLEQDSRVNELPHKLILAIALIRREKMELVLQKAAELGASEIVPFVSSRCVVKEKKEKADRLKERWNSILLEASEQCKRNEIPYLNDIVSISELKKIDISQKVLAYEDAYLKAETLTKSYHGKDVMLVIGPEGGFSTEEVEMLRKEGFECVTLGSRILRAETAAIFGCSVIGELMENSR